MKRREFVGLVGGAAAWPFAARAHANRLQALVVELVHRPVSLIIGNSITALAAKAATTAIPIVFTVGSDPVKQGLVASLNRPAGNVTGVSFLGGVLGPKRLELLRQLVPQARTIAMLVDPRNLTPGQNEATCSCAQAVMPIAKPASTLREYSMARNRPICRSCNPRNLI
jgi:putative ABC transport system substrate-binding protein